jgi:hypothetical protein
MCGINNKKTFKPGSFETPSMVYAPKTPEKATDGEVCSREALVSGSVRQIR